MAPVHARMSAAGRILVACCAALALAMAAHAAQRKVTTIDELRTAISDPTIDQIVVTSHITLAENFNITLVSGAGDAFNQTVPMPAITRDLAIWGDCADPLPAWATALNIPSGYVQQNACGFLVSDTFVKASGSTVFQLDGGLRLWVSNLVMHNAGEVAMNYMVAQTKAMWAANMVMSEAKSSSISGQDANVTASGVAFMLAVNDTALFARSLQVNSPIVTITGCLAVGNSFTDGTPFSVGNTISGEYSDDTMTVIAYNNTIKGSANNNKCTGLCIRSPANISIPILYGDVTSMFTFGEDAAITPITLDATNFATLKPQGDEAAWLTTLVQAGVPGADKVLSPTLPTMSSPPPPDKAATDSPPPASSALLVTAAHIVLAVTASALLLV